MQKVDPALIAHFRPAMVGCFQPIFFFADHSRLDNLLRHLFAFAERSVYCLEEFCRLLSRSSR